MTLRYACSTCPTMAVCFHAGGYPDGYPKLSRCVRCEKAFYRKRFCEVVVRVNCGESAKEDYCAWCTQRAVERLQREKGAGTTES